MPASETARSVHAFYQSLHFNEGESPDADAERIDPEALVAAQLTTPLPHTAQALDRASEGLILDVGCGVGWLASALSLRLPQAQVVGLDFSERALARAEAMRDRLGAAARFERWDVLDAAASPYRGEADLVLSIGALHHTGDFPRAFRRSLARAKRGGSVVAGLYHAHRRAPFLAHMAASRMPGGEAARAAYFALDGRSSDPTRRESWYLDQAEHPHETRHTLAEVLVLAGEEGFAHVENTITGAILPEPEALGRIEARQRVIGEKNLAEGRYDPGFFLVHLKRIA